MSSSYTLDKIKFATDPQTFERAVDLYESGKVTKFTKDIGSYSAVVIGSRPYNVSSESRRFDYGSCDCYLGQNDKLCKHLVALTIYVVMDGKKLSPKEKEVITEPKCNGSLGELSKTDLSLVKKSMTLAMRFIKAYDGPSNTWFAYQNSLDEGCNMLSMIVSDLPTSKQTTKLLIDMMLRIDKKLSSGGVDDSNGRVGGFIEGVVEVLKKYAILDTSCIKVFKNLVGKKTCFGWEMPLVDIFENAE